jgi:tRNA modification GTPase
VSQIAGTTRDVIDIAFNIAGYPVILSDTAGLRKTNDIVEQEGIKRALEKYFYFYLYTSINIILLNLKE